jgi:DNA-binding transcriptional ArsR family regulator
MVNYSERTLNHTFAALAHPSRRAILKRLARRDSTVQDLARPLRLSLPAIAKHLAVLESGGLVISEKRGRVRHCRLRAKPLQSASAWLDFYRQFWQTRLDELDTYLSAEKAH